MHIIDFNMEAGWIEHEIAQILPSLLPEVMSKAAEKLFQIGVDSKDLLCEVCVEDLDGIIPAIKARRLVSQWKQQIKDVNTGKCLQIIKPVLPTFTKSMKSSCRKCLLFEVKFSLQDRMLPYTVKWLKNRPVAVGGGGCRGATHHPKSAKKVRFSCHKVG